MKFKKNVIELKDSIIGFAPHENLIPFLEMERSPTYNALAGKSNIIF